MLVEVAADIKAKAPFLKPNILPKKTNAVLKTIIFLFSDKSNQKINHPKHLQTKLILDKKKDRKKSVFSIPIIYIAFNEAILFP